MTIARNSFGICFNNNYTYIAGGISENYKNVNAEDDPVLDHCERYNVQNNKWETIGNLNKKSLSIFLNFIIGLLCL